MDQLIEHAERLTEDHPELNALEVIQALSQLHLELDKQTDAAPA